MILIVQNGLKSFTDFSELCDAFFRKKKEKKKLFYDINCTLFSVSVSIAL